MVAAPALLVAVEFCADDVEVDLWSLFAAAGALDPGTLVLAALAWTGLARVVRGKILSLREEDYAMAARA